MYGEIQRLQIRAQRYKWNTKRTHPSCCYGMFVQHVVSLLLVPRWDAILALFAIFCYNKRRQPVPRCIIGQSRDMGHLLTGTILLVLSSLNTSRGAIVIIHPSHVILVAEVLQDSRNPPYLPPSGGRINITYTSREAKRNVKQPTGEVTSWQTASTRPRGEYKIISRGQRALYLCHGWIT